MKNKYVMDTRILQISKQTTKTKCSWQKTFKKQLFETSSYVC